MFTSFRFWFYLSKLTFPAIFAIFILDRFVLPQDLHVYTNAVFLGLMVLFAVATVPMGILMALGKLKLRCPFCGQGGPVYGNKEEGCCLDCENCGTIRSTGPLGLRLTRVPREVDPYETHWALLIEDVPPTAANLDDIPDDFEPQPLGKQAEVVAAIRRALPDADFKDPAKGHLQRPGFSITFLVGAEPLCEGVMLYVDGDNPKVLDLIAHLLQSMGRRAIDQQTGDVFALQTARTSFAEWLRSKPTPSPTHDAPAQD